MGGGDQILLSYVDIQYIAGQLPVTQKGERVSRNSVVLAPKYSLINNIALHQFISIFDKWNPSFQVCLVAGWLCVDGKTFQADQLELYCKYERSEERGVKTTTYTLAGVGGAQQKDGQIQLQQKLITEKKRNKIKKIAESCILGVLF